MTKSLNELAVRMLAGPHENPDSDIARNLTILNRKIVESLGVPAEMLGSSNSSDRWIAQRMVEYYWQQMLDAQAVERALLKDK